MNQQVPRDILWIRRPNVYILRCTGREAQPEAYLAERVPYSGAILCLMMLDVGERQIHMVELICDPSP